MKPSEPLDETCDAHRLYHLAHVVAQARTVRTIPKRHGAFLVYEDDRIVVGFDTHWPIARVYAKSNCTTNRDDASHRTLPVLSTDAYGRPHHLVRGPWESHLAALYDSVRRTSNRTRCDHAAS